jgi:hypothetical protein
LTIFYEEKKITLRDFTVDSCIGIPSLEDIDHICKMVQFNVTKNLQEKQDTKIHKSQQWTKYLQQENNHIKITHKKETGNINEKLSSKDDEIPHLRNHNKTLLLEIKKLKNEEKEQQKDQTMDKGTDIDAINVEKLNIVINETVLVEEIPKVEIENKVTSIEGIKDLKMEVMHKIEDEFNKDK